MRSCVAMASAYKRFGIAMAKTTAATTRTKTLAVSKKAKTFSTVFLYFELSFIKIAHFSGKRPQKLALITCLFGICVFFFFLVLMF